MKILYVGPLNKGGTCLQRMEAFIELGSAVTPIDTEPEPAIEKKEMSFYNRVRRRLVGPCDLQEINRKIINKIDKEIFDTVWIDKGIYVYPDTLRYIKKTTGSLLVHYNTDDIMRNTYIYRNYLRAISLYDIHFTTNVFNIAEMKALGAKRIYSTGFGYDQNLFRPIEVSHEDRVKLASDIFFIGHWEPKTEELIYFLARKGLSVTVRGQEWHRARRWKLLYSVVKSGPVWCEEYVKTLCSGKIGLGILSKWNRNKNTVRIFEIPACGTFLLAERTPAVESFFCEGIEAEFFSSPQELAKKAIYYLGHEQKRKEIAYAGYKRCVNSAYSWKDRVKEMICQIEPFLIYKHI